MSRSQVRGGKAARHRTDRETVLLTETGLCICKWMLLVTGELYSCEITTRQRCEDRQKREASASAPSAKPPLSNRGVSSGNLTPCERCGNHTRGSGN